MDQELIAAIKGLVVSIGDLQKEVEHLAYVVSAESTLNVKLDNLTETVSELESTINSK